MARSRALPSDGRPSCVPLAENMRARSPRNPSGHRSELTAHLYTPRSTSLQRPPWADESQKTMSKNGPSGRWPRFGPRSSEPRVRQPARAARRGADESRPTSVSTPRNDLEETGMASSSGGFSRRWLPTAGSTRTASAAPALVERGNTPGDGTDRHAGDAVQPHCTESTFLDTFACLWVGLANVHGGRR